MVKRLSKKMNSRKRTDERITVSQNMLKYGGCFIRGIGEALVHADEINTAKIKVAFPDEWAKYLEMSRNKTKLVEV
jgi:hypothetical protein